MSADRETLLRQAAVVWELPPLPSSFVAPLRHSVATWAARKAAQILGSPRVPRVVFTRATAATGGVKGAARPGSLEVRIVDGQTLADTVYFSGHEVFHALVSEDESGAEALGLRVKAAWQEDVARRRDTIFQSAVRALRFLVPATFGAKWHAPFTGLHPRDRAGLEERIQSWYGRFGWASYRLEDELEAIAETAVGKSNAGFLPLPRRSQRPASPFPSYMLGDES